MQAKDARDHPVPGSENELESEGEQERKAKNKRGKGKAKAKAKGKAAKAKGKAAAKAKGKAAAKTKGKAAAKAKGKAAAKAKGKAAAKTKGKAAAKAKGKAAAKATKKAQAQTCPNTEEVETAPASQGRHDPAKQQEATNPPAPRNNKRGVSKKPAASKATLKQTAATAANGATEETAPSAKRQAATFARRNQPSTDPAKRAWNALRDAFRARVMNRVSSPSSLEDCLQGIMSGLLS